MKESITHIIEEGQENNDENVSDIKKEIKRVREKVVEGKKGKEEPSCE